VLKLGGKPTAVSRIELLRNIRCLGLLKALIPHDLLKMFEAIPDFSLKMNGSNNIPRKLQVGHVSMKK
jgi:hypothetical protein